MTPQARKRRLQDTLAIAGGGVIAFSVWDLAKTIFFLTLFDEAAVRQMLAIDDAMPMMAIYIATGFVFCIDLAVRAFVGLSARSEGRGEKKSPFYLVVAVIAALVNFMSALSIAFGTGFAASTAEAVISLVIELTAFAALALVVYCSVRLRLLNRATG